MTKETPRTGGLDAMRLVESPRSESGGFQCLHYGLSLPRLWSGNVVLIIVRAAVALSDRDCHSGTRLRHSACLHKQLL